MLLKKRTSLVNGGFFSFLIILSVFLLINLFPAELNALSPDRGAVLEPSHEIWDMGHVRKGDSPKKKFSIINSGSEEALIERVHSCCGYTADISDWSISPGGKSEVVVGCDTSRKAHGIDVKYLTVIYNSRDGEVLKIPVRTYVVSSDR